MPSVDVVVEAISDPKVAVYGASLIARESKA